MTLAEAIRGVAQKPVSIQARAQLASVLDEMGTLEASRVWAATIRLAASRGQFFPAFFLLRMYVPHPALQTQLLVELAETFGANRKRGGEALPPPLVHPVDVAIPEELDRQIYLAVKLGCQIQNLGLPPQAQIPEIPLFGALPTAEFVAFSLLLKEVMFHPGEVLIRQDDTEQSMYLVANGQVRITKRQTDGSSVELAVIPAPAVVGEMSLLTAVPRRATVTTQSKGLAWRVDAAAIGQLARAHPELMKQLDIVVKRRLLDNLIQSSELFRIASGQIDLLLASLEVQHVPAGSEVVTQGTNSPGLYILLHGEAEIWNTNPAGESVRMATLDEGGAFGEMSLLSGQPTTATVVMPQGGVLLHLPTKVFASIRQHIPSFEGKLNELMVVRHTELQSIATPFTAFEEVEPDDPTWLTGEFESFQSKQ
jgi:CRP-like cAMP-binding protein